MSMEAVIVPEIVTPEMINEAVAEAFALPDTAGRALELPPFDEASPVSSENSDDDEQTIEVETAEEVSLKNGVYHEIKRKLNERFGIPLNEIAFAHDADTPAKKAELYKAVNAGRIRILIGSTGKMGTGVNVQKRLIALHHLDQPWKPAELEQREGRILRQGNLYKEVFIFNYVTTKSFDGYMLQTLESKARFISQIMAGEVTARTAEDVGDMVLSVAQVKAIASGNPLVQQRIELEVKLVKLDRLRAAYYNNRARMRDELEELPVEIQRKQAELAAHHKAIEARQPASEDAYEIKLRQNIGDAAEDKTLVCFDKRERAGAHIRFLANLAADRLRRTPTHRQTTEEIGRYRGFRLFVHALGNARLAQVSSLFSFQTELHLCPETTMQDDAASVFYVAQIGESNIGITQSIDWQLRHLKDRAEQAEAMVGNLEARLTSITDEVERPWQHAREYRRLRRAYETMGAQLQADGITVEANTTFTDGGPADETDTADDEQEGQAASTVDETIAKQNPYTGLEEWNIVVEESGCEEADGCFDESADGVNNLFGLPFADGSTADDENGIFLAPAREESIAPVGANETDALNATTSTDADVFTDCEAQDGFALATTAAVVSGSRKGAKKGRRGDGSANASRQVSLLFG